MNKVLAGIIGAVVVAGGLVAFVMVQGDSSATTTDISTASENTAAEETQAVNEVSIADFAYSPESITVKAGTAVTWTNQDTVGHTVTTEDGSEGPDSETLAKGDAYSYTFNTPGTYNYYCAPHPYMKGTVVVTE